MDDDEIVKAVDELADKIDVDDVVTDAGRLGIEPRMLLRRVFDELVARMTGSPA